MKPYKSLAKYIKSLLVRDIPCVDEPVGYILGENGDIFVIGTEIAASLIISSVNSDNRLGTGVPVVIGINFFSITQLRIVLDDMLFSKVSFVVLINLMPVIFPHEFPAKFWHRMRTTSHYKIYLCQIK